MSDTIGFMITGSHDAEIGDGQVSGEAPALDVAGQQRLAEQLVVQAKAQGMDPTGAEGLLARS